MNKWSRHDWHGNSDFPKTAQTCGNNVLSACHYLYKSQDKATRLFHVYQSVTANWFRSSEFLSLRILPLFFLLLHLDKFGEARYFFQGQCRDVCPEGFFHSARSRCEPCPADCIICTAADHCLHCSQGHTPRNGRCVPLECSAGERCTNIDMRRKALFVSSAVYLQWPPLGLRV